MVPQLWDDTLDAPPISLRVSRDLPESRLALTVGTDRVWSGNRRNFLRQRRIAMPRAVAATGPAKLSIVRG